VNAPLGLRGIGQIGLTGVAAAIANAIYHATGKRAANYLSRSWSIFMNSTLSLPELEDRIAILRDNIRQLIEQAAGAAGSENEEMAADRIAQQSAELDRLVLERDARAKK
jgi:hypothetical protein